jgi:hypothetical protein
MAIRDPAPIDQRSTVDIIDKSFYEPHDILHVEAKYPECPKYLTDRLGRAITGRRQYLSYREKHQKKLSKDIEKIGIEEPRTGEKSSNASINVANVA